MGLGEKIRERFIGLPVIRNVLNWSKERSLPGFQKIPIYDVIDFFINEAKRDSISTRAGSMAFTFMLALFPALLFLVTLIPYIPVDNLDDKIMLTFQNMMPESIFQNSESMIRDMITKQRGELLSFGFIAAFFFASNGVMALMNGFNKTYPIFKRRSPFQKRVVAFGLVLLFIVLFVVSTVMIFVGTDYLKALLGGMEMDGRLRVFLLNTFKYVIIALLFYVVISLIFYYGPSVRKKWSFFSPGSTLATVLSILASTGFAFFINNFATYNKLYGSIGTVIALMIWLYINALVLLVGFELNASININRRLRDRAEKEDEEIV